MPDTVVIDVLYLTVGVPAALPDAAREPVPRTLAEPAFADRLLTVVLAAVREFPALAPVTVTVSR